MSGAFARIRSLASHLRAILPMDAKHRYTHSLSPTFFLERAVDIEPDAEAVVHTAANGGSVRRSYRELADRVVGLAYYLKKHRQMRVGVLAPNTPAFLEEIYGIVAAGGVLVPVNYRLKGDDIAYIFELTEVDCIIVDAEMVDLLEQFRSRRGDVPLIVDRDWDVTDGPDCGAYNEAVREGQQYNLDQGDRGWAGLHAQVDDELDTLAIPFTSVTTSRPKGVVFSHRGAYLAAMANIVEAGMNETLASCINDPITLHRCVLKTHRFHAVGWTFPWAVVAVRGINVCLRKIDYPVIWKLLAEERVTHYCAAPTVNTLLVSSPQALKLPEPVQVTVAASPPSSYLFEKMVNLNLIPVHTYGMTGVSHALWRPDGSAQIIDRSKDVIISGGENISSVALESLLVQHPAILEVGVVGVPDEKWGERPKAYVTVKEGKSVEGEDVISWAREQSNISRFMVPREVEVVRELPKASTGKIKNELREWAMRKK